MCSEFKLDPSNDPSGALGIGPLVEHPPLHYMTQVFQPFEPKFRVSPPHNRIRLQHHNTIANRREVCCSTCLRTVVNIHLKKVLEENRNHEIAIIFAYLVYAYHHFYSTQYTDSNDLREYCVPLPVKMTYLEKLEPPKLTRFKFFPFFYWTLM